MSADLAALRVPLLVRRTAEGIAAAFYDEQFVTTPEQRRERSKAFRWNFRDERAYVRGNWPYFVKAARRALADVLRLSTTSEHEKRCIYEALLEDHAANSR